MERSLAGLRNHLIVCGYGRMGRYVCREFSKQGLTFVLIDRRPDLIEARGGLTPAEVQLLRDHGYPWPSPGEPIED